MCAMSMCFKSIVYITQPVECATFVPILVAKCRLSHVFRRALRSLWVAFSLLECGFLYHKMWQMVCVWSHVGLCFAVSCRFASYSMIVVFLFFQV